MHAVIKSGGKQYRVHQSQVLRLETLPGAPGETISFEEVLMVGEGQDVRFGTPLVAGAKVTAEVMSHGRRKKIDIIKMKRRKHHMKRMGHRQNLCRVVRVWKRRSEFGRISAIWRCCQIPSRTWYYSTIMRVIWRERYGGAPRHCV